MMIKQKKMRSVCAAAALIYSEFSGILTVLFVSEPGSVSAQSIAYECVTPPDGYDQEQPDTAKGEVTEITYHS